MSGHSKWKQIKHKKAATDSERSRVFSRLSRNISIAAKEGADPQFNSSLRQAIEQAKKSNMPQANIDRAVKRGVERAGSEPLLIEIYGSGGIGILVEAMTDNSNRTIGELRAVLKDYGAKMAEKGSLLWAFEKSEGGYESKFPIDADDETRGVIVSLVDALEGVGDVVGVYCAISEKQ